MVLLGVSLIFYGGGVPGVIEIMSLIGNVLSYARLMALGMASVMLAIVANRFAESIEVVFLGVVCAVALHVLNICLALFSPTIHSMRLHLVEFFSKFYKGGGKMYAPFKKPE